MNREQLRTKRTLEMLVELRDGAWRHIARMQDGSGPAMSKYEALKHAVELAEQAAQR